MADSDPDDGLALADEITEAITAAEEMAFKSIARGDHTPAQIIGDRLTPALIQARTYAEVGMATAPEVRLGISEATVTASELADLDSDFGPLLGIMYRLREDAERSITTP